MEFQTDRSQWNYQEKMERHYSIETKFPIESKRSICVSTEILTLFGKVGLETRISGNVTASFGRTGQAGQRGPGGGFEAFHSSVLFISQPKFTIILA